MLNIRNFRPLLQLTNSILNGSRNVASSVEKLIILELNDKTGISTLTMNRLPVNGLNLELMTEMNEAVSQLASNKSKGLIITSNSKTVFSAGLDIMEMYKPDPERLRKFWISLQDLWLKLYGSSFPIAAAINGNSPAGGCLLALSCEYRVMCPNFSIGLNETKLGIIPTKWIQAGMRNVLPTRVAELALTLGKLFPTDEALKIGLIDEVASDKNDAIMKCEKFLLQFSKISPQARAATKQVFRGKDIQEMLETREQDLQDFLLFINQPAVQKGLEIYLESLKKKK